LCLDPSLEPRVDTGRGEELARGDLAPRQRNDIFCFQALESRSRFGADFEVDVERARYREIVRQGADQELRVGKRFGHRDVGDVEASVKNPRAGLVCRFHRDLSDVAKSCRRLLYVYPFGVARDERAQGPNLESFFSHRDDRPRDADSTRLQCNCLIFKGHRQLQIEPLEHISFPLGTSLIGLCADQKLRRQKVALDVAAYPKISRKLQSL